MAGGLRVIGPLNPAMGKMGTISQEAWPGVRRKGIFWLLRKIDIFPCAYFCLILHLTFEQA